MSTARPADPRVSVRRVGPEDWEVVRDLRLRALRDAPAAFESTYEGEQGRSGKEWRAWLTRPTGVTVVATLNGQPAGLAGGYVDEAGHVELVSMWVTPSARGSGMADALVAEVVHWARMRDVHEVRLWVTRGNDVAERLYSRHGFVRSGQAQPLPPTHPCVDEIGMRLVLSDDHQTRARPAEIQMEVE